MHNSAKFVQVSVDHFLVAVEDFMEEVLKVDVDANPIKTADNRRVFSLAVDRNCDGNVSLYFLSSLYE